MPGKKEVLKIGKQTIDIDFKYDVRIQDIMKAVEMSLRVVLKLKPKHLRITIEEIPPKAEKKRR